MSNYKSSDLDQTQRLFSDNPLGNSQQNDHSAIHLLSSQTPSASDVQLCEGANTS